MFALLASLPIRTKIWLGFGLLLAMLAVISGMTLVNLRGIDHQITEVVKERQPAALLSQHLSTELQKSAAAMGFYLLSGEDLHKKTYEASIHQAEAILTELQAQPVIRSHTESLKLVASITADIVRFRALEAKLYHLGAAYTNNFPALQYSNINVNPINRELLQLTGEMLMSEKDEEASNERKEILTDITELRYYWAGVMRGIRGYLAFRNQESVEEMNLYLESSETVLARLTERHDALTFEQQEAVGQFRTNLDNFRKHFKKMMEIHGGEQWRTDTWLVRSQISPLFVSLNKKLTQLLEIQTTAINDTSRNLLGNATKTSQQVATLLVISLVIGILLSWFIGQAISRPIREAAKAMQDISSGDGDLTCTLVKSGNDEIGQLADCFNLFTKKIRSLIGKTSHSVNSVMESVVQTTEYSSHIAHQISEQESETEQVATAIHQMTATTTQVAGNAAQARAAAEAANAEAGRGQTVVTATVTAIRELAQEIGAAEGIIREVAQNSENIGTVLDVIRTIAEQTNLLALNAAIEAARAGEHGRGFAVVADEVRSLANRTRESTNEIEQMISNLQEGTGKAVQAMMAGCDKANANVEHAEQTLSSLHGITQAITSITNLNTQIALAAEEQRQVSEEINRKITRISDTTSNTAESARATQHVVETLGRLASELQSVVNQFSTTGSHGLDFEAAKAAHLDWRTRLRGFIDGKDTLPMPEATSHKHCQLGRWYYGAGLERYSSLAGMKALEAPHIELHKLIQEVVNARDKGQKDQMERLYAGVGPLSERIMDLLDKLELELESQHTKN
jgi:methyl-accepting chemotaxis protein